MINWWDDTTTRRLPQSQNRKWVRSVYTETKQMFRQGPRLSFWCSTNIETAMQCFSRTYHTFIIYAWRKSHQTFRLLKLSLWVHGLSNIRMHCLGKANFHHKNQHFKTFSLEACPPLECLPPSGGGEGGEHLFKRSGGVDTGHTWHCHSKSTRDTIWCFKRKTHVTLSLQQRMRHKICKIFFKRTQFNV